MNEFRWHRPTRIAEAVDFARGADDARYLAGGQSLLPTMKLGLATPGTLIDLSRVAGLGGIDLVRGAAGGGETGTGVTALRIGAATTHETVAGSTEVGTYLPALADLAERIGDPAVRAYGTLGGSLANNDPAACYPAGVLGLGATIHTDRHTIGADDFFVGLYETALAPDELITAVTFPVPAQAGWAKFAQPASRFSLVGVFVSRNEAGAVRVAVTGAGSGVFRCQPLEQALSVDWSPEACRGVTIEAEGLSSDLHASARYRAHLIPVLAARAVAGAGATA